MEWQSMAWKAVVKDRTCSGVLLHKRYRLAGASSSGRMKDLNRSII